MRAKRRAVGILVAALLGAGCSKDTTAPPPPAGGSAFAFVTTTDFQTGSSSAVWFDGSRTTHKNVAAIYSDAVARFFDGLVYVVNRFGGDNIQILDPANGFSVMRQFSVGNGSDPHDIVVIDGDKAYVTLYNTTKVSVVDPTTGTESGTIDLGALADADGIPEIDRMTRVGDRVFVTVQRLDRNTPLWDPVGESYIAVIDVTTDTIVDVDAGTAGTQPITLTGYNPFSTIDIDPVSGRLCVAVVGDWGVADGGVEVINPATLQSEGFVFREAEVNGDITDVVIAAADIAFVIYTDAVFNSVLQGFNPLSGQKNNFSFMPGGFVLQDIALAPNGELFVTDRTQTRPGIRIYDPLTASWLTMDPIDVGLPPFAITFGTTP